MAFVTSWAKSATIEVTEIATGTAAGIAVVVDSADCLLSAIKFPTEGCFKPQHSAVQVHFRMREVGSL